MSRIGRHILRRTPMPRHTARAVQLDRTAVAYSIGAASLPAPRAYPVPSWNAPTRVVHYYVPACDPYADAEVTDDGIFTRHFGTR